MNLRLSAICLAVLILATLIGCSSNPSSNPITPGVDNTSQSASSHYLWGYWNLTFDESASTVTAVPMRSSELHANVVKFLEGGKLYLAFENLKFVGSTIDLDVKLTHPFPGMSTYTGFDVKGILITPGAETGYSDPGIVHSSIAESYLTNADGWTRWWNPTEFPIGTTIFNYVNGKLGNPYNNGNLNATLNGYKYFSDDLKTDSTLDSLNPAHRGLFQPGYTNGRHYTIHFDPAKPFVFNYAVDASWEPPVPDPPVAIPQDFPPAANAPEAYRVTTAILENDLFYIDPVNKGGHAKIDVRVYDWFGCANTEVKLDTIGVWNMSSVTPSGGNSQYSSYMFEIDGSAEKYSSAVDAIIMAVSHDAQYGLGKIADQDVATYMLLSIPVSGTAVAPMVASIDPNHGEIKKTVTGAKIDGAGFASNASASLLKDGNPAIVIDATNVVVTGDDSITCDFALDGASVIPGKYDVRVTNPDTSLYGELDKGFSIDDLAHPWPGWMAGGLNQAASKYPGYGSAGSPTAPKWTYQNATYGGPSAGCAIANDGTIYICTMGASPSGPATALHAINPDGTLKWVFTKPGTCWNSYAPALDKDGYVYVCLGTPSVNYLYKVDPATHTEVWACNIGNVPCYPGAPAIGLDGAVYVFVGSILSQAKIQQVKPDGSPGWFVNLSPFAYSYTWQLGAAVLPNGNIVFSGGSTGKVFCYQPDGTPVWEYQDNWWNLSSPAVGPEGNVYFSNWEGKSLMALDSDGNFKWKYDTTFYVWATPAVDPNTGNVFFGDRLGKFRCFTSEGAVVWTHDFGASHIDGGAAVDGDGNVYVAIGNQPSQPIRALVKMNGTTGNVIWESDDLGYMITTSPAIGADGTIYLPGYDNAHTLFAWGP